MPFQPTDARILPTTLLERMRQLLWPVWSAEQRRLSTPLRALLASVLAFLLLAMLQTMLRAGFDHPERAYLGLTGSVVVLVGAVLLIGRVIDRRPVSKFGLSFDREWWCAFVVGGIGTTAINGDVLVVMLGADWATFIGVFRGSGDLPFVPAMVLVVGYTAFKATWEEFILRGATVKNLAEGSNGFVPRWIAVGLTVTLSTLVFALLHRTKVTHFSQYRYYLIAGLVLNCVCVLTGGLALSSGIHVFYDFTQNAIFGLGHSQQTPELFAVDIVELSRWVGEERLVFVGFAVLGGLLLIAYLRSRDGAVELDYRVTSYARR